MPPLVGASLAKTYPPSSSPPPRHADTPTPRYVLLALLALLSLATFLAYANSFHVPFIFDDDLAIAQNETIRDLADLRQVLTPPSGGKTTHGRPLVNLSLAINYALGGLNVLSYHLVNLAIHVLNGLLLFGLVRRTLQGSGFSVQGSVFGIQSSNAERRTQNPELIPHPTSLISFTISLLWLLHPLCTQAVTYIIQRAESLAACFYLLTLYSLLRSAEAVQSSEFSVQRSELAFPNRPTQNAERRTQNARRRESRLWAAGAILACALGMSTKETMVTAPLAALLFDRAYLSNLSPHPDTPTHRHPDTSPSPWRNLWQRRSRLHLALMATWFIQLALQLQPGAARNPELTGFNATVSPLDYLITQAAVISHYLRLAAWPDALCFDYRWPIASSLISVWPQLLLIAGLAITALVLWLRNPRLAFPLVAFFLILAPTSSIMPIADPAAEHRMYLPLAALVVFAVLCSAFCVQWLARRRASTKHPAPSTKHSSSPLRHADTPIRRYILIPLPLLLLAALAATLTHLRNRDYHSEFGLWQDTLTKRPQNARAWYNRGYLHQQAGRNLAATRDYENAMTLAPEMPGPYYNRGNLHMQAGRVDAAIADYTRGIERENGNSMLYYNRGIAFVQSGRIEEAIADFTACVTLVPRMANAWYQRADALAKRDRYPEAIADYTRAIQYNPTLPDAYHNRAAAYAMLGQFAPARADLDQCRRLGYTPSPELVHLIENPIP